MGLTIKHATLSNVPDEGVPGEIGPSEWNEGHTITDNAPIVILATGQSNFVQTPAFTWSPESRAKIWNYNHTDGNLGNAFVALSSTTINVVDKFASEIARLNPTRSVYVINISIATPGQTISRWLPGASSPDMYQNILNNITPALAAIGATTIDLLLWWQGEAHTAQTSSLYKYAQDWTAVHAHFLAESWFPRTTPIIIFGLAPTTISASMFTDIMNGNLQEVVRAEPDLRRYIHTGTLEASYWDGLFHLTGSGYDRAGAMAAAEFVYGPTRNAVIDPVKGILRPQVLGRPALRNLLIGGDFTTNPWQRGTTFTSVATGAYTADRWRYATNGSGVVDIAKTADAPTIAQAGMFTQHCLDIAVTTADTSIAGSDQYAIQHRVEGLNASFLGFGQSSSRPITISFWVKSTKTGKFWLAVRNGATDRSYVTSYTVDASNTWEFKIATIPADVSGTWLYTNGIGFIVSWTLVAGSNVVTTPDVWIAGNFVAGDSAVNALDTVGNHFKLALIQIEEGVGASPFEQLPQDVILDRCRRYYRKSFALASAPVQNVGNTVGAALAVSHVASASFGARIEFDNNMRAVPTVTTYNPKAANANWRDVSNSADRAVTVGDQSESGFTVKGSAGAADADNYIHWQAEAEL